MPTATDTRSADVTLCGTRLTGVRHICAFFDSREEQYEILNPYFAEGIAQGEEVITIFESSVHHEHVARMTLGGVPVGAARASGQLKVLRSEDTYMKDGVFVVDRMYKMIHDVLEGVKSGPFTRVRACGDMEWALQLSDTDDLIRYEAKVSQLTPHHDCALLCVYDVNRFSGRVLADVLSTHSHVLLEGKVHENPHYTDPVKFLQKLALRRPAVSPRDN
jgi:hypothetical protein